MRSETDLRSYVTFGPTRIKGMYYKTYHCPYCENEATLLFPKYGQLKTCSNCKNTYKLSYDAVFDAWKSTVGMIIMLIGAIAGTIFFSIRDPDESLLFRIFVGIMMGAAVGAIVGNIVGWIVAKIHEFVAPLDSF